MTQSNGSRRPRKRAKKVSRLDSVPEFQERALSHQEEGRFEQALYWTERAFALIEKSDDKVAFANCLELKGFLLGMLKRHEEAIEMAGRARSAWLDLGNLSFVGLCDSQIAHHLKNAGRTEEAMDKLQASRAVHLEIGEYTEAAVCLAVADLWTHGIDIGLKAERLS